MNNILLVNICLLATVAAVYSYSALQNFGGDSFLQASQPVHGGHVSETESRSWSRTVERQRRQAPPPPPKGGPGRGPPMNMCCNVDKSPDMDAYREKSAPIFKECMDENKSDDNGPKKFEKTMECVAKKKKQIDDAGKLNSEAIKASFKEMPLQDYQKSIVDTAVPQCVTKAGESQGDKGGPLHSFHRCMMTEFMKACPKDKQDNSEHCVRMREGKGPDDA